MIVIVREGQSDLEPSGRDQRRLDPHRHLIAVGMSDSLDMNGRAVDIKRTGEDARPDVEPFVDILQVGDGDL